MSSDARKIWQYPSWKFYRSPWPMLLKDGRILVLFTRRMPPLGIGGVVSEDEGKTWSQEFVVRKDAALLTLAVQPRRSSRMDGSSLRIT